MRFGIRATVCAGVVAFATLGLSGPAIAGQRTVQSRRAPVPICSTDVVESQGFHQARDDVPNDFCFPIEGPGVLTVVVRGAPGTDFDLFIEIVDEYGDVVFNGYSDQDLGGRFDAEQLAVTLARPGEYTVRVGNFGGSGQFFLGANWIKLAGLERESEHDDFPDGATRLTADSGPQRARVDEFAGDPEDWWYVANDTKSLMVVTVRTMADGDLVLEAYAEYDFIEPLVYSDDDLGAFGNESVNIELMSGERIYLLVRLLTPDEGTVDYSIEAVERMRKKLPE